MTLLAIILAIALVVTIHLFCFVAEELFESQRQLEIAHRHNAELRTRNYWLISEATTLNAERDYLARRNVVLEASFRYRKECLAGAMLRKQLVNVDAKLRMVERSAP